MAPNSNIHHARCAHVCRRVRLCRHPAWSTGIPIFGPLTKEPVRARALGAGSLVLFDFALNGERKPLGYFVSLLDSATVSQPSGTSASLWHCVQ